MLGKIQNYFLCCGERGENGVSFLYIHVSRHCYHISIAMFFFRRRVFFFILGTLVTAQKWLVGGLTGVGEEIEGNFIHLDTKEKREKNGWVEGLLHNFNAKYFFFVSYKYISKDIKNLGYRVNHISFFSVNTATYPTLHPFFHFSF